MHHECLIIQVLGLLPFILLKVVFLWDFAVQFFSVYLLIMTQNRRGSCRIIFGTKVF
jgi:hypothetical protein